MEKTEEYNLVMRWSNSVVVQDPVSGEMFQIFQFKKPPRPENDCREVCNWRPDQLHRPLLGTKHFACATRVCRIRRAYKGEIPQVIPVSIYVCAIRKGRGVLREFLTHKFANLFEWVANL